MDSFESREDNPYETVYTPSEMDSIVFAAAFSGPLL